MYVLAVFGKRVMFSFNGVYGFSRSVCSSRNIHTDDDGFGSVEHNLTFNNSKSLDIFYSSDEEELVGHDYSCGGGTRGGNANGKMSLFEQARFDARRALEVLNRGDCPDFNVKLALDDMQMRVSGVLVREVLSGILRSIDNTNKKRYAKLGFKFFVWSGQQKNYSHTVNSYHLMMKIFADSEEFKAMVRLFDEMIERGFPTSARTFNILICTCGKAGLGRKVIQRFIKSKRLYYRPFKHSFNAIICSLLNVKQYRLIEWVYRQMLSEGHHPDILTYNVLMCAKIRMRKLDEFHRLLDDMGRDGFFPDLHTFNILLHVLGRGDKPLAALNLLSHMTEVGIEPSVLHFTTLIDGLGRAGNLDACKYFFEEMLKYGCRPDVVCYTAMITGFIAAGELEMAQNLFSEMIDRGQLPNVFTYNSMIRGFCMAGRFKEARLMLKEMESRGCTPNLPVYNTLVRYLRNAGKLSQAHEVLKMMMERGKYVHLISKVKRHRRGGRD